MNEYQVYKKIRLTLAARFERELKDITAILEGGLVSIAGARSALDLRSPNSLIAVSEAGHVLHAELKEVTQVILERYRRNLKNEIVALGLQNLCNEATSIEPREPHLNLTIGSQPAATNGERSPTSQ